MVGNTGFEPVAFRTSSGYSPAELIARKDTIPHPPHFSKPFYLRIKNTLAVLFVWWAMLFAPEPRLDGQFVVRLPVHFFNRY